MFSTLTEVQQARRRQTENRAWLDAHITELQAQYPNRWILVLNRRVAADGDDPAALETTLRGNEDEAVVFKVPAGEIARPV